MFDNFNEKIDECISLQPKYSSEYLIMTGNVLVAHTKIHDGLNPILIDCILGLSYPYVYVLSLFPL